MNKTYEEKVVVDIDGNVISRELNEVDGPAIEDQIADKEAELLKMYQELEELKQQQG